MTFLAGITNGVVGVCAVPFEHAGAGGPAVTGFPAVDGLLSHEVYERAVDSIRQTRPLC